MNEFRMLGSMYLLRETPGRDQLKKRRGKLEEAEILLLIAYFERYAGTILSRHLFCNKSNSRGGVDVKFHSHISNQ